MTDIFDITRREFIRNSALLSAGTALGHAAVLPQNSAVPGAATSSAYVPAPVFPYGAVYFRKTNPPETDWARDHQTAAQVGMNIATGSCGRPSKWLQANTIGPTTTA
jgi:hypothetical protein